MTYEPPDAGLGTERAPGPENPAEADEKKKKGGFFHELPILILIAFGLALLIKTFLAQAFVIPSGSMEPTLHGCDGCTNDRVLVNKLVYRFRDPRRGEIIVFVAERDERPKTFWGRVRSFLTEGFNMSPPGGERDFIKRVIGLPGETIEVDRKGRVFITPVGGERFRLEEPYIAEVDRTPLKPTVVPANSYFVMGDNRPQSSDSRSHLGPISQEDIIGKAFMRIWPPKRIGFFRTPSYDREGSGAGVPGSTPDPAPVLALLPALRTIPPRRRAA